MIKDYLDLIIAFVLGTLMLFSSKSNLEKIFHKKEMNPSVLKLIKIGGVIILLGAVAGIVSKIFF